MKTLSKRLSLPVALFLALPVLLLVSCGGDDLPTSNGCPSGSYVANSNDIIVGPEDTTFTGKSSFGAPYGGGTVIFPPLMFTVTDSFGVPRNNICLSLYTGDSSAATGPYWYSDATYGTLVTGTGPFNFRTVATNDAGVAILYWSTGDLPAADLAYIVPPATTLTAGADQAGTSHITVQSGSVSDTFRVVWTVQGQPAQ